MATFDESGILRRLELLENQISGFGQIQARTPDHPPGVVLYEDDNLVSVDISPRFRHLNFIGATVDRSTDTTERADIIIGGGVGFCFDYLIDKNYTGTAGAVTTLPNTTTTFKTYAGVKAAVDDANTNRQTNNQSSTFFICDGRYTESSMNLEPPGGTDNTNHYRFMTTSEGAVVIEADANSVELFVANSNSGSPFTIFEGITFETNGKTSVKFYRGIAGTHVVLRHCRFIGNSSSIAIQSLADNRGMEVYDCFVDGGTFINAGNASNIQVTDTNFHSVVTCFDFTTNVSVWHIAGCRFFSCTDIIKLGTGTARSFGEFTSNHVRSCTDFATFAGSTSTKNTIIFSANHISATGVMFDFDSGFSSGTIYGIFINDNTLYANTMGSTKGILGPSADNTKVQACVVSNNMFINFTSGNEISDWAGDPGNSAENRAFHNHSLPIGAAPHAWITLADIGSPPGHVNVAADIPGHTHEDSTEGGGTLTPTDLLWAAATELTIVSGAITATQSHHTIDTQSDAATDDLDTINGLVTNQLYFFRPANGSRTVVLKHGTGNILCIGNADLTLEDVQDFVWAFSPDGSTVYAFTVPPARGILLPFVGDPTFRTVEDLQKVFHSSGWVEGGVISVNSGDSTNIDVSAGDGVLRIADDVTAQIVFFDWAAITNQDITTNTARYIGVEYNSGSPQVVIHTSYDWNFTTDFPLGNVVNEDGTIHIENSPFEVGNHADLMNQRLFQTLPRVRDNVLGGLIVGETGTRQVTLSAGAMWDGLSRFPISALDTSVSGGFDTYSSGGKEATDATQWPNAQYDNSGTLTTMTNNRWANLYWYLELDGGLIMVYGTAQYTSSALAGEESLPTTLPTRVTVQSRLIARFIFQKSASTAFEKLSAFTTIFAATGVTDHGNLAGLADDDHAQYRLNATALQFSDVFSFVTSIDALTLVTGVIQLPAAPFGLIAVTSQSGATDDLVDIEINGGGTTLVPGTQVLLTNTSGDTITLKHDNAKLQLSLGVDVSLASSGVDMIVLQAINSSIWIEVWRSASLMPVASLTVAGKVELATAAEINTSTAGDRAMSPGEFSDSNYGVRMISFTCFGPTNDCETGTGKAFWHVPAELTGMNLVSVRAAVFTAGTTGSMTVAVFNKTDSAEMLSTLLTFGTPSIIVDDGNAVIDGTKDDIVTDDIIQIDVDTIHTTPAKGLIVTLGFRIP